MSYWRRHLRVKSRICDISVCLDMVVRHLPLVSTNECCLVCLVPFPETRLHRRWRRLLGRSFGMLGNGLVAKACHSVSVCWLGIGGLEMTVLALVIAIMQWEIMQEHHLAV